MTRFAACGLLSAALALSASSSTARTSPPQSPTQTQSQTQAQPQAPAGYSAAALYNAANAYARAANIKREEFLARFGAPMPPRQFGEKVVSVLDEAKYAEGFAFGLKGDTGITMIEGAPA